MGSLVLFVCTGNTCRSPMAEALFTLALPGNAPWRAASAGLAACPGCRASECAAAAIAEVGGSLADHRSQPLSPELVQEAAAIVAMTEEQMRQLAARFPSARDKLFLLLAFDPQSEQSSSVSDPFCGTLEDYRHCRDLIRQAIPGLIDFLANARARTT